MISDKQNRILMLKASYGRLGWGLPGGALDPEETIHEALIRECREELGCEIEVQYLSGVYYHAAHNSQAFIFRCQLAESSNISLGEEHTEFVYMDMSAMSGVQRTRVNDCLNYKGATVSAKF